MSRVLKVMLLYLLVLAFPMQGYAAANTFSCVTTHHHATAATGSHDHAGDAMMDSGSRHHQNPGQHGVDDNLVSHGSDSDTHAKAGCNTCSVCCVGVALIRSGPVWSSTDDSSDLPAAAPVIPFSGHIPATLERPPRFSPV